MIEPEPGPRQKRQSGIILDLRDSVVSMRRHLWREAAVLALLFCLFGWMSGLRNARDANALEAAVRSQMGLLNIECVTLGQSWAVFEAPLEESAKRRWAAQWEMQLLAPEAPPVLVPSVAMLREWAHQESAFTPEDVERWQERYLLKINHGYHREWSDGSKMLVDLKGNRLIGIVSADWARQPGKK